MSSDRKWSNENDPCLHCPEKYLDQNHLLNCQYLLGKNEILSNIPGSKDIFNGSLEEQQQQPCKCNPYHHMMSCGFSPFRKC